MYYGYAEEALSVAYDNRAAFFNWQETIDKGAALSEPVRARPGSLLAQSYGDTVRSIANVYPAPAPHAPVLVFVHGGYWRSLDIDMFDFVLAPYLDRGVAGINLEYDLAPAVTLSAIVRQVRVGVRWVSARASDWNGDPSRIVVAGHSAGGHLAVMAGLDEEPVVRHVVSVGGVYDLEPVRRTVINDDLRMSAEEAQDQSPIHVASGQPVPVSLFCGAGELAEFRRQQRAFAAALASHAMTYSAAELAGHDHFSAVFDLATPGAAPFEDTMASLEMG